MSNPCGTAISLAVAHTIVVRALAHARSSDFPSMTVAVLDAAGRLVALAGVVRDDNDDVIGVAGVSGQLADGDEACGLRGGAAGRPRNLIQPSRLMSKQTAMSRIFGKIAQIGYVVRDIDASIDQWVRRGVGPWFYVDRVQTDYFLYRGVESELEVSVAVANSGELQLELIQPRNDASSAFTEFLDAGHEGAQHVAYWTEDFQQLYDNALSLGYTVTQEGSIGGEHGRFAYLDTEHDHGTAIEISDISGPTGPFFSDIRDAAANWDGTDPIRRRR